MMTFHEMMNLKTFLLYTTIVFTLCSVSYAFEAVKNDVQDLRVSTFVKAIRRDGHWQDDHLSLNEFKTDLSPNSKCRMDLEYIINELQNVRKGETISDWTLEFLDSIGKVPSDIGQGKIFWVGDQNLCQRVNVKERDFKGQYCLSIWHQPSNPPHLESLFGQSGLRLGLCLPDSCSIKDDLNASIVLYQNILDFLPGSRALHEVTRNLKYIECKISSQWTFSGYCCILCMLLLVVVTFVATSKDRHSRKDCNQNERENSENILKMKVSVWVTCFSFYTSLKAFKWTESRNGNMDCLSGLRFLCTIYILSAHVNHFATPVVQNSLALADGDNSFYIYQIMSLGPDTLFLLSGLLMAYQFFRGVKNGQRFNLIHFCLKRYLRVIAPVVFLVWFHATVFPHLGSGPFWDNGNGHNSEVVRCQENWWRTVLGIHNLFPVFTQCQGAFWQSGADFQMSILSPVFLFALKKSVWLGMGLIAVTTVLSVLVTGLATWKAGIIGFPSLLNFGQTAYMATWCRLGPYLIGIVLGYYLTKDKSTLSAMSKSTVNRITWISALLCVTMFLGPLLPLNVFSAIIFYAVQKVFWSLGLAGLIILSINGHLPTFNRFLSWKPFVQLSQFSYSVNIFHVFVFIYFFNQMSTPLTLTPMFALVLLIGLSPIIFAIGFLHFVLLESPITQLGKILFSNSSQKKVQ